MLARAPAEAVSERRTRRVTARHFGRLIGRPPDDAEAQILARLFAEQRNLFAREPGRRGEACSASASRARDAVTAARRRRRDDDRRERDHELRRIRGDAMRLRDMNCPDAPARCPPPDCRGARCSAASAWASAASRSPTWSNPARRCSRRSDGQDRGVLGGQLHHSRRRPKRVIYLFMAGGPSQIETFDYKPVLAQRNGEQLPDSVRQGQRLTGMSGNQSSLPLAGSQFGFGQHGSNGTWVCDLLPQTAQDRRRPLHRPLDVHRRDQPRPGDHVLPDRLADRGAAEHGVVDSLRPRQRQREPAGVRRPHHAGQSGSAAVFAALGQRVPSGAAPGRAVPQRQGRCAVPGEPRRRHAREPPAAARSAARPACARRRAARRHRGRRAHRAVRDVVPHAGERARSDGRLERDPRKRSTLYGKDASDAGNVCRQLPAGAPARRARREVHPALSPGLGPARQPAARTSSGSARKPIRPAPRSSPT